MSKVDNLIHENTVISIREITPANAAKILDEKNFSNRILSETRVNQYKRAMVDGEWQFNGDPIRFSSDKVLSDGQHRLKAVVLSGVSQSFLFVENLPRKSALTIDIGKARTGGDVLSIEAGVGPGIAATFSGCIQKYITYKSYGHIGHGGRNKLTNTQVVKEFRNNNEFLIDRFNWLSENLPTKGSLIPKSDALLLLMVTGEIDIEQSNAFIESILSGVGITTKGQISHLRDYLIDCKTGMISDTLSNKLKTIIKVWNSMRSGKEITQRGRIRFNHKKEEFKVAI